MTNQSLDAQVVACIETALHFPGIDITSQAIEYEAMDLYMVEGAIKSIVLWSQSSSAPRLCLHIHETNISRFSLTANDDIDPRASRYNAKSPGTLNLFTDGIENNILALKLDSVHAANLALQPSIIPIKPTTTLNQLAARINAASIEVMGPGNDCSIEFESNQAFLAHAHSDTDSRLSFCQGWTETISQYEHATQQKRELP